MHLKIGQRKLHYSQTGHGPTTLILVHGGPGLTLECLNIIHTMLPEDQFTVLSYNQSGSALNENAPFYQTVKEYANELNEIIGQMDAKKIVLFGHSWGGAIVQEYLIQYPDTKVRSIVLANSFSSGKCLTQSIKNRAKGLPPKFLPQREELLKAGDIPGYINLLSIFWYPIHVCRMNPFPNDISSSLANINMDVLIHYLGPDLMDINGELLKWDRTNELKNITLPTLVMSGEFDYGSRADFDEMVSAIPNAKSWHEAEVSHFPMYEKPEAFKKGLLDFLETI